MRVTGSVLSGVILLAACSGPGGSGRGASASGATAACEPTATSDNGCADGMACSPMAFDEARGEHVARCVPGGPADEGQTCGPRKACRAGHLCNIIPDEEGRSSEEPGICFRLCNVELPLCPGSSCRQLPGGQTQWLTVDGVRYGLCGSSGPTRQM